MAQEIWKDIKGFENLYQVSNKGEIRSLNHYGSNGSSTILYKGRTIKKWLDSKKNYLMATLSYGKGTKKNVLVHRVVAQTFLSNIDDKKEVNHINGIKTDNRVENLEWVTSKENKEHAYNNGLYDTAKFRKRGSSKNAIRILYDDEMLSLMEIAEKEETTYFKIYDRYIRKKQNG